MSPPTETFLTRDCASIMEIEELKEPKSQLREVRVGKLKELAGQGRPHVLEVYEKLEAILLNEIGIEPVLFEKCCAK